MRRNRMNNQTLNKKKTLLFLFGESVYMPVPDTKTTAQSILHTLDIGRKKKQQ